MIAAWELARAIQKREMNTMEALEAVFQRIEERESTLRCYITLDKEEALRQARQVQRLVETGGAYLPLAGVPLAVKDNICTGGMRTTCGSRMLADYIPDYDAEAVARLRRAGAVILGKANLDEFAMGTTTETSYWGATRNPRDPACSPGGSSGGAAAAVAAGECLGALGSDTGGSIRLPAAHCGVVGLKPAYGSVSRFGLAAFASSLDQIGPMTANVRDCALIFDIISGHDKKDATSLRIRKRKKREKGLKEIRVGLITAGWENLAPDIARGLEEAAEALEAMGGRVTLLTPSGLEKYILPAYEAISSAEACSNLARYDGIRYGFSSEKGRPLTKTYGYTRSEGFGEEVRRRLLLGTYILGEEGYDTYYVQALKARRMIRDWYKRLFEQYDLLLGPVSTDTAPLLGQRPARGGMKEDFHTAAANLAGCAALSLPWGRDRRGLPIGIQLEAPREEILFQLGECLEEYREQTWNT